MAILYFDVHHGGAQRLRRLAGITVVVSLIRLHASPRVTSVRNVRPLSIASNLSASICGLVAGADRHAARPGWPPRWVHRFF
jgi:hypothetical protein